MPDPTLLLSAAQSALGGIQSIIGGARQSKALKQLEKLQTPTYTPTQSILDYYNESLKRYNVEPTDSSLYKRSMKNINMSGANALSSLQSRGGALGGTSSILRAINDAKLNAEVAAEGQREQRFGQLGAATQLESGERQKEFEYNKLSPYQKQFQLLGLKASGGGQLLNAGISNIFGGLQSGAQYSMLNQMYGGGGRRSYSGSGNLLDFRGGDSAGGHG